LEYNSIPVVIPDYQENISFSVFPNPASDQIQIILPFYNLIATTITIRNIQSAILYTNELEQASSMINLDGLKLPAGIYFITMSQNGKSSTKKLIIQ
jgi:hypothetical protein